jgi:hypothetical protein
VHSNAFTQVAPSAFLGWQVDDAHEEPLKQQKALLWQSPWLAHDVRQPPVVQT